MDELVLQRLAKLRRKDDRKALIDAAQCVAKGSLNPLALELAKTVLRLTGAA